MFYLEKTVEISAAHFLKLPYKSKCQNLHGHNYKITIYCKTENLDSNGMVLDFAKINEIVKTIDHENLNKIISQPTAENIAKEICDRVKHCYKVRVKESEGNEVIYET